MLSDLIGWFAGLPPLLVYVALGAGAAVENVVPAVPADTFVLLGGFLSARGSAIEARWVFGATWAANVVSALVMYRLGFHYGRRFFDHGWGTRMLNPHQMRRMRTFYERWGISAIFFTRFLPGLRSIVPIFAGVTHQPFWKVAPPLVLASAVWYGALVYGGALAGRNFAVVREALSNVNGVLLAVALLLCAGLGWWWWHTRHHGHGDDEGEPGAHDRHGG